MNILNQNCCSDKTKQYISCGILLIGLIFYCCYMLSYEFMPSAIVMLLTLLSWIAFNLYHDTFNNITFAKILSFSGLLLSISIFFFYGVQQLAFPEGAIRFHNTGIALSLSTLLLSIFPLLFIRHNPSEIDSPNNQRTEINVAKNYDEIETQVNLDDWEIATDDDVENGNFEVAA